MPVAYVFSEVEVTDPDVFKTYLPIAAATVKQYGGEYLSRGESVEVWEGAPAKRMVMCRFPSAEAARTWYDSPEYAVAKAIRLKSSTLRMIMAEGLPD